MVDKFSSVYHFIFIHYNTLNNYKSYNKGACTMTKKDIINACLKNNSLMYCVNTNINKEYYILCNGNEENIVGAGLTAPDYKIIYCGSIGSSLDYIYDIIETAEDITDRFIKYYKSNYIGKDETTVNFSNTIKIFIQDSRGINKIALYSVIQMFLYYEYVLFPYEKQTDGTEIVVEPKILDIDCLYKLFETWKQGILRNGFNNGNLLLEAISVNLIDTKATILNNILKIAALDMDYYNEKSIEIYQDCTLDTLQYCDVSAMAFRINDNRIVPKYQSDLKLNAIYKFDLSKILYIILYHLIEQGYSVKKCANCGKIFIQYVHNNAIYCDRKSPQDKAKTCKEYGNSIIARERAANNEEKHLYKNICDKLRQRKNKYPDNPKYINDFEKFKAQYKKLKSENAHHDKIISYLRYYMKK